MSRPIRRIALLAFTVCLLALPAPVTAKPKPCGKLCRADLRDCRKSCTGTAKEKRLCRKACRQVLNVICQSIPERACFPTQNACGAQQLNCTLIALTSPEGYQQGDGSGLPADFPAAPGGVELCGSLHVASDTVMASFVFFVTALTPDEVLAYYATAFGDRGYTFVEDPSTINADRASCDRGFRVLRNDAIVGGIYYFAQQGAYTVISGQVTGAPPTDTGPKQ